MLSHWGAPPFPGNFRKAGGVKSAHKLSERRTLYHFIRGTLVEHTPGWIILEANGIGFEIAVPASTDSPARKGAEILLWTHLAQKDEGPQLFGFLVKSERDLFRLLIKVTGIGPKLAMQILSGIKPSELVQVMMHEDWKRLTLIPGIGPKTARRLLIELKEKLTARELQFIPSGGASAHPVYQQAFSALTNLGFAQDAVYRILKEIQERGEEQETLEEIIKTAIARLAP
jgi:holliday junction DNA helicase RuvA